VHHDALSLNVANPLDRSRFTNTSQPYQPHHKNIAAYRVQSSDTVQLCKRETLSLGMNQVVPAEIKVILQINVRPLSRFSKSVISSPGERNRTKRTNRLHRSVAAAASPCSTRRHALAPWRRLRLAPSTHLSAWCWYDALHPLVLMNLCCPFQC
jgi:hypothetical protein